MMSTQGAVAADGTRNDIDSVMPALSTVSDSVTESSGTRSRMHAQFTRQFTAIQRRETLASLCAQLPKRAPSRERLGVGYGSYLDQEMPLPERRESSGIIPVPGSIQARLDYAEHVQRRRATSMLCLGAVFGGLGFVVAAFLGMWKTFHSTNHDINLEGVPFPSGQPFWPSSVSEMVNDRSSPVGKSWMCFQVIAAISIWLSWYPWELRNVYVGGHANILGIPFLHLRTFVPPVGLLMLVLIPLSLAEDLTNEVATSIHLIGAVMMLGGHGLFELYTLAFAEFVHIQRRERLLRWVCCLMCLFFGLCFLVLGQIPLSGLCCGDVRRVPTPEDIAAASANGYPGIAARNRLSMLEARQELYDTASGTILVLKYLRYWFEVAAGFSMIASLITIWYFCPERKIVLGMELPNSYLDNAGEAKDEVETPTEGSSSPRAVVEV